MSSTDRRFVIVVGAGPSGLLLTLLLARAHIPVLLLEKGAKLDKQPRATHYGPPAMSVLNRAGVVEAMAEIGFYPQSVCWRTIRNERLAGIDHSGTMDDPDKMVCLPLNLLGKVLLEHVLRNPCATVLWGHEVTEIRDENGTGVIDVATVDGKKEFRASYVVGCDGANSKIRRLLFGDDGFSGKTWDVQVVATNAYYDFHKFGYEDANFIIHPEHWYMASRITRDGMWRVSYGESAGMTRDELLARQPKKWKEMLPGSPDPADYKIVNFSPYKVHQRLAKSMRVGPFVLAADAAHLCNPFGGLGLTGGIVDIGCLFDCLAGIHQNKADDSILDVYSNIRRKIYTEFVDPISSANLVRMYDSHPETILERDPFLQLLKAAQGDQAKMSELVNGLNVIKHDFTKYYMCNQSKQQEDVTVSGAEEATDAETRIKAPK